MQSPLTMMAIKRGRLRRMSFLQSAKRQRRPLQVAVWRSVRRDGSCPTRCGARYPPLTACVLQLLQLLDDIPTEFEQISMEDIRKHAAADAAN